MLIFCSCLYLTSASVLAATFQSGLKAAGETRSDEVQQTSDPQIVLQNLWSIKGIETRDALKSFTEHARVWADAGAVEFKHIMRVIELLGVDESGIRSAAEDFFAGRADLLFEKSLLTSDTVEKISKKSFLSEPALTVFLRLVHAMMKHPETATLLTTEHVFQVLDALDAKSEELRSLATSVLARDGITFSANGLWNDTHTKAFLREFGEASRETRSAYLEVLTANLPLWVAERHFAPAELRSALTPGRMHSEDEEKLIDFLANPQTVKQLRQINFYDRAWAEQLLKSFREGEEVERNWAQVWISRLMRAFAQSGTLSAADFKSVWQGVADGLGKSSDPFGIVNANMDPLLKSGWLSQNEYNKLLVDFDKKTPTEQKRILEFINEHYERFAEKGWVSATPLVPAVFGTSDDPETQRLQLSLLKDHPDLITEKQIFSAQELPGFFKLLESRDGETFDAAVEIIKNGFDTWTKQGLLTKDMMVKIIELDPGRKRTAHLLNAVLVHFDHSLELYDRALVLKISEYGFSPHDEIIEEIQSFFVKNFKIIESNKLISPKLKRNLVKAEIWNEIPQSDKKKLKRHKYKGADRNK